MRSRIPGRRRWFVAAAVAFLVTAIGASPGSPEVEVAAHVADAELPWAMGTALTVPGLSAGAPTGATRLASAPVQQAGQAPPAPTVIDGLAANGIPNVALNAYRVAAARMASSSPSCGIDWSLLAGIGRVESNHGRYRGAVLSPDGTASPRILGPALDGGQFAFIGDSDDGMWDGDKTYDRAMGPMQFIPTTWRSYAIDADANGVTDPFNINDAALAAANYLCRSGGDLRTQAGQIRAVLAYNHSDSYVAEVLALARAYAAGIPVADIPIVGITSGAVPPPTGSYWAPAAPGPAIGAKDTTPASGDTVGASSAPAGSSGAGATPAAQSGTAGGSSGGSPSSGTGTGTQGSGTPPPSGPAPAGSPPPSSGGPAPAQPAPAPAPVPAPVPLPAPPAPAPAPAPLPAPPPPPPPPPLVPGVTCNPLGGLLVHLPACP